MEANMTKKNVVRIHIDPARITEKSNVPELAQVKKALAEGRCVLLAPASPDAPSKPYVMSPAALQRLTTIVTVFAGATVLGGVGGLVANGSLIVTAVAASVGAVLTYAMVKRDLRNDTG